jgi:hypothetical protein
MHEQHTTRPQPHEHLLVGWIVGGMTENGREGEWQQWQQRERHTACPQPHEPLLVGWIAGGTTRRPARPSDHDSTPNYHHEPLLVGWKGVLHEKYGRAPPAQRTLRIREGCVCVYFYILIHFIFLNSFVCISYIVPLVFV